MDSPTRKRSWGKKEQYNLGYIHDTNLNPVSDVKKRSDDNDGEGGVQLPQSGESLIARLRDVLQTLAQVVTVVLCQATEPPGSGKLGTFLFQRENIFTCGRNRF